MVRNWLDGGVGEIRKRWVGVGEGEEWVGLEAMFR